MQGLARRGHLLCVNVQGGCQALVLVAVGRQDGMWVALYQVQLLGHNGQPVCIDQHGDLLLPDQLKHLQATAIKCSYTCQACQSMIINARLLGRRLRLVRPLNINARLLGRHVTAT
jgi:hypothetical protein